MENRSFSDLREMYDAFRYYGWDVPYREFTRVYKLLKSIGVFSVTKNKRICWLLPAMGCRMDFKGSNGKERYVYDFGNHYFDASVWHLGYKDGQCLKIYSSVKKNKEVCSCNTDLLTDGLFGIPGILRNVGSLLALTKISEVFKGIFKAGLVENHWDYGFDPSYHHNQMYYVDDNYDPDIQPGVVYATAVCDECGAKMIPLKDRACEKCAKNLCLRCCAFSQSFTVRFCSECRSSTDLSGCLRLDKIQ